MLTVCLMLLAGCQPYHSIPEVKYYDLTPGCVGAAVYWERNDPMGLGLDQAGCDRYLIDSKTGAITPSHSDSASEPGLIKGAVQAGAQSTTGAAIAGPVIGAILPAK